jgi:predicted dehydrogenase
MDEKCSWPYLGASRKRTKLMPAAKVRIAVAGAGQIGKRHIGLIVKSNECALAAVVDPASAAAAYAHSLGVPLYKSLAELFAKDRPDGVILATPNRMHVEQTLECVTARMPTLVEKPVAHTLEAGIRLCAATEAANVPVLVGHHRRHSSIMAKAIEIIDSGILGKIVAVVGTALFYKAESEGYYEGAFSWRREPGGGPILINMIHEVSNLRSLCGEIVAVQAFSTNATRNFPVEDTAAVALRFANGALGTFMLSDTAASDRSWEHTSGEDPYYVKAHTDEDDCYLIAGTFGSLAIPTMRLQQYPTAADRSWHRELKKSVVGLDVVDPLERQIAHFADVIRGNAIPLVSVRDGLQNLRVVDAIVEAAQSGRVVHTL